MKTTLATSELMSRAEAVRMVEAAQAHYAAQADRLRETAAELRAGTMNVHHCANRLELIADAISPAKRKTT